MEPTVASDPMPRGERLATLRALRRLTQTQLAASLEVSQGFISQVESGLRPMPDDLAAAAAHAYGVPLRFFEVRETPAGYPTFRKSSRAGALAERAIVTAFDEAARLFREASQRTGYRAFDVTAAVVEDEEETAENIRSILGVDDEAPVQNTVRALERLGVGVVNALIGDTDEVHHQHTALSRPAVGNDRPIVATVTSQSGDRDRLTRMHELGHLIYDRELSAPIRGTRSSEERRAYRFAGAMLVPASVVRARVGESLTLQGFLPIKADYGVSVAALIVRARDLHVITEARARSLFIQMGTQGWKVDEPVPVAEEAPLLITQAVQRSIGTDARLVADETGVPVDIVARATRLQAHPKSSGQIPGNVVRLYPR